MNIVRSGLALGILMLVIQATKKSSAKRILFTGLPAILLHYSALFSLSYIVITQRPWLKLSSILGMLTLLLLSGGAYLLAETYFLVKAGLYQPVTGSGPSRIIPSIFGVFRISIILIVLLFCIHYLLFLG